MPYTAFARALPDTRVFYAVKANPAPEVLRLLAEMGSCFDTASVAEMEMVLAAGATVDPGRTPHSLHAYFLRPGDPFAEIRYAVDRIRDGRSFTTRRVVAWQERKGQEVAIFALTADFHAGEQPVAEHLR
mgnify:CR=1 FL=1